MSFIWLLSSRSYFFRVHNHVTRNAFTMPTTTKTTTLSAIISNEMEILSHVRRLFKLWLNGFEKAVAAPKQHQRRQLNSCRILSRFSRNEIINLSFLTSSQIHRRWYLISWKGITWFRGNLWLGLDFIHVCHVRLLNFTHSNRDRASFIF